MNSSVFFGLFGTNYSISSFELAQCCQSFLPSWWDLCCAALNVESFLGLRHQPENRIQLASLPTSICRLLCQEDTLQDKLPMIKSRLLMLLPTKNTFGYILKYHTCSTNTISNINYFNLLKQEFKGKSRSMGINKEK